MCNWPREGRWKNECWGEGVFACVLGKLKRRYRRAYHRPPRVVKEFIPRRARFYNKMTSPRTSGPTHAVERSSNRNTIRSGQWVVRRSHLCDQSPRRAHGDSAGRSPVAPGRTRALLRGTQTEIAAAKTQHQRRDNGESAWKKSSSTVAAPCGGRCGFLAARTARWRLLLPPASPRMCRCWKTSPTAATS